MSLSGGHPLHPVHTRLVLHCAIHSSPSEAGTSTLRRGGRGKDERESKLCEAGNIITFYLVSTTLTFINGQSFELPIFECSISEKLQFHIQWLIVYTETEM